MTSVDMNIEIDVNEITCPITLDIFHDPVRISDGYVYERKAILNWFISHGTSPITREEIKLKELRRDYRLKELSARYRAATLSTNVPLERLILPAAQVTPAIITKSKSTKWIVVSIRNQRWRTLFRIFRYFLVFIGFVSMIVLPNVFVPLIMNSRD